MKYEILPGDDIIPWLGLKRIRALKDFDDVKCGDLGGLVSSEINLSQNGNCWIYEGSRVDGISSICGNAKIKNSIILGSTLVSDDTLIQDSSCGKNLAIVGHAKILNSMISGSVHISGKAIIISSEITGYSYCIGGDAVIDNLVVGYGNIATDLNDDIRGKIRALCNVVPIQGIYSFFIIESDLIYSGNGLSKIYPNMRSHCMDDPELLVLSVHQNDIDSVMRETIYIRKWISLKPVYCEEKETEKISKLDLILNDD
jgi:hypothetical protein